MRTQGHRDPHREAANALNFWQALEYMAPQKPPTVKAEDCVWQVAADAPPTAMPWSDLDKLRVIRSKKWSHRRYQLFAGIIDGPWLIDTARRVLGALALDDSERKPPQPAACVMVNVDQDGFVNGEVFVSALPWAMAKLVAHRDQTGAIDFTGFFGQHQKEEQIRAAVKDLLYQRKLIADEALAAAQPVTDEDAEPAEAPPLRPVVPEDLAAITSLVFDQCGWVPEEQEAFRVQAFRAPDPKNKKNAPVIDDPLNSFFAEDLERVTAAHGAGDVGAGLARYLAGVDAPGRVDLDRDVRALIAGVHPSLQPRGCWPSAHPLVTAQQFAVNTAVRELSAADGLFAVNGPPGTGKTTMLKDIVAAIVVQRADVMAQFDQPADAFRGDIRIEDSEWPAARLDAKLQGFGIVVSSANNGAVENISKDFPSLAAVAPGLGLDYFSVVADSAALHPEAALRAPTSSHWGLLTAVMGNKANRNLFAQRFWFEGFPKKPKPGEPPEPLHPLRLRGLQELVKSGEHGALPWATARANYLAATKEADRLIALVGEIPGAANRQAAASAATQQADIDLLAMQKQMPALQIDADAARRAHDAAHHLLLATMEHQRLAECVEHAGSAAEQAAARLALLEHQRQPGALSMAEAGHSRADRERDALRVDYDMHVRNAPGTVAQLLQTQRWKAWQVRNTQLEASLDQARADANAAYAWLQQCQLHDQAVAGATALLQGLRHDLLACQAAATAGGVGADDSAATLRERCAALQASIMNIATTMTAADAALEKNRKSARSLARASSKARSDLAKACAEFDQFGLTPEERQRSDLATLSRDTLHSNAPYFTQQLFEARRLVFSAAMDLHKAFIVAAWPALRKSLSAFVNVLTGATHPDKVTDGVAQLWDAFFLVVPVVSTTFASFPRLFSGMRRDSLAWLLIDEAGQAAPQQAVGAIWRARRTVLVGDPRQLEPVVGVPEELMEPLLVRCGAEAHWAPPLASAQTLADRANRYGMHIGDKGERIWLGAPLLVHRRCLAPMFGIANAIAYQDKMVYGSGPDTGGEGIGPSRWIDITGAPAQGHWIAAQADHALALVAQITGGKLRRSDGQFKVIIVTPFRLVSGKIRELLTGIYGNESRGMSGTVHTFQGKEAEHVIFLLGGDPQRPGVIGNFAGKKPNLVNVAVTRAKRRLYVIGDRDYWTGASDVNLIFQRMAAQLPVEHIALPGPA
ncbi:MAG: ATP-binding protein [Pseudomonadota bacterium]|nr:ATP-binding protein [Pseudomonadota bacterium]